jgi:mono/diheme cytochrome c family protein/uncharacterized membrane protein
MHAMVPSPTPKPNRPHRLPPLILSALALTLTLAFQALAADSTASAAAAPAPADAPTSFQWNAFLGPFHMLVLHLPIGFIAAAAALEALAWRRPSPDLRLAARALLGLTLASGIAAAVTGLLRASQGGFDPDLVLEHRNHGYGFLAFTLAACITAHFAHRPAASSKALALHRITLTLAFLMVTSAGHHGGSLTHGSRFLAEGAPAWLAPFLGHESPTASPAPAAPAPDGQPGPADPSTANPSSPSLYASTIQPLFESKCYACHGPEKHRGDYRLDLRDHALRGGDSGAPGIVPGDPTQSSVLRLILLPRDHDDAMPPEGKPGLTPAEILAIAHWIQAGAPFDSPSP